MKEFYAVGHIVDDLEPAPHLGGGVSYAAMAVTRLGMAAHVITKAPPGHPYLSELSAEGIAVHRLPPQDPGRAGNLTSFRNFYDASGRRRQVMSNRQEDISSRDLSAFPPIPEGSVILAAPVIGEVHPELFPEFADRGYLVVTPQGYFRQPRPDGTIERRPWPRPETLREAELVILSDEDLAFGDAETPDEDYLHRLRDVCKLVVLTQGAEGLTVYERDHDPLHVRAWPMKSGEIVSPTGAGDACAAAFTWHYTQNGDLHQAAAFGAFYPALKLMGIASERRGVQALPSLEQVKTYIRQNPKRFAAYLAINGLKTLNL